MKMSKFIRQTLPLFATILLLSLPYQAWAADKDYVLNTASTGGTYHPVGTAIATLTKVKLLPKQKFSLTAVNSAGHSRKDPLMLCKKHSICW